MLFFYQVWRGYVQKRRAKIARAEEKIFLKMVCMRESSLCFGCHLLQNYSANLTKHCSHHTRLINLVVMV